MRGPAEHRCDRFQHFEQRPSWSLHSLTSLYPQELLEDTHEFELIRAGGPSVIYFFMIEKATCDVVYFVKCETANLPYRLKRDSNRSMAG